MRIIFYPNASDFDDSFCSTCANYEGDRCNLDFRNAIRDYTGVSFCSEYIEEDETEEE